MQKTLEQQVANLEPNITSEKKRCEQYILRTGELEEALEGLRSKCDQVNFDSDEVNDDY
jgi:hypothetical protein